MPKILDVPKIVGIKTIILRFYKEIWNNYVGLAQNISTCIVGNGDKNSVKVVNLFNEVISLKIFKKD